MSSQSRVAKGLTPQWDAPPAPQYERVKQMITAQIASGAWAVHQRVPSESELVAQLGLSRMTINRALRELTAEGLLVRMQGVGTFVAEAKGQTALFEIHNIADEIAARGHIHRAQVMALDTLAAPPEVAAALSVAEGFHVYHSLLVHFENDLPVQIEDRFVHPTFAPDYLKQNFKRETPYVYLMQLSPVTEAKHVVEAILAEPYEAKVLKVKRSEPCLLIKRTTWSGKQPATFARLLYPGSRYRLEGVFGS
ncbi:histidine utilization repressor [Pseudomonas typographi]|uniref:Histidine utilization repressor n=1 Tax=Pseudomonas typographi TaxID=2715964 RepID=A0ABR7Z390_9PSED|nr:histidine utilization repressor [Pseudomonas typographi]MBD1550219.1 histidine utilization repressor [Pseudomonas typographi]MBD1599879.1 histidine utilization repressor [Pseudomonas typographi]